MQRIVLLLASMTAALLLIGGVALADHLATTVQCPTEPSGDCWGPEEESAHIIGTEGPEYIFGGFEDDQIDALGGDDYVNGGHGDDTIYGGGGGDRLDGADGNNKIFGGTGQDELDGYDGNDFLHGGAEHDDIDGWSGKDQIRAGSGPDEIYTGRGDRVVDTVDCGSGSDVVLFEKGIDKINSNCEKKNPY